jgi:hypothetical protein
MQAQPHRPRSGGLSADPMWQERAGEIRALRLAMIRLVVQEYFDLLPAPRRYHFDLLDRSVDLIRSTGVASFLSISSLRFCFQWLMLSSPAIIAIGMR